MKACEHFLPCGYCNKYDVPCKATADGIIDYNYLIGEIDLETAEEMKACNANESHDCNWIVAKAEAVTKEEAGCATYYTQRCSVCGKERIKKVEFDGNHKSNVTIWELKT